MKGSRRNPPPPPPPAAATAPSPPPVSPTGKATAKYTNKDGSKFITVPKPVSGDAAHPSPQPPAPTPSDVAAASTDAPAPGVNKKKAKRRAKAAAKAKAEQDQAPTDPDAPSRPDAAAAGREQGEADYDDVGRAPSADTPPPGDGLEPPGKSKKTRKKKKKSGAAAVASEDAAASTQAPPDHAPGPPSRFDLPREKIWNTSSQEERDGIKDFWLSLSEEARKSLVKVEKDAVLKKMKEQQKHTCGCTVCGRKRSAIEEELEGLYDAYYEELEQYAHEPSHPGHGPPMMAPPRHYDTVPPRPLPSDHPPPAPSRGRIVEHVGDEDDEDDEADLSDSELDDEDEDDYSGDEEEIPADELHRGDYASEFFNFGNSLTVQGGILTVADDLLKNDGKKFIEMMEQLAERRMAREEDVRDQYQRGYGHGTNGGYGHNVAPSEEEEDYPPEEEDDEYTSQDDDYEDEEDAMTEEQRMEEGRRMFQIFAARMFEQRVLNAYREKVARERQEQLIREIENDERKESEQMAKKAKEAQKRKDKAAQKKQAQAEKDARREAEKAAEAAQRQADEARRADEQRTRAEEKRRKKEAQKKAEDEERLRREADRLRRAHEQKERQAEQERRAREAKDRERKAREEARALEQEARERKEREARERREKQERDKRDKEAKSRANEARERQKQADRAAQKAVVVPGGPGAGQPVVLAKRPSQQHHGTVPALPQQPPGGFASPQVPVATPALPKGPTPARPRQPSQQGSGSVAGSRTASQTGSAASQNPSPNAVTPVHASPAPGALAKAGSAQSAAAHAGHAASPPAASARPVLQPQPAPFGLMSPMTAPFGGPPPPVGPPPGFGLPGQYAPLGGGGYRAPGPLPMIPMPPGMGGPGRGFVPLVPPPGFGQPPSEALGGIAPFANHANHAKEGTMPSSHSRQPSDGFDSAASPAGAAAQPIARPGPIGRPTSVVHGQRGAPGSPAGAPRSEADDPHHLGSKALLEGSETALDAFLPRAGIPSRPAFGGPAYMDPGPVFSTQSPIWNNPMPGMGHGGHPFGQPTAAGFPLAPWPTANASAFASHGSLGRSQPRSTVLRRLLCEACKDLAEPGKLEREASGESGSADDFLPLDAVKSRVEALAQQRGEMFLQDELAKLYDTEGDAKNGGGNFEIRRDATSGEATAIRWVADPLETMFSRMRKVGEISSPVLGSSSSDRDDAAVPWGAPPGLQR